MPLLTFCSLNGLAGKIIKGKFPSVSSQYSKNLRALVNDMLATNPKKRPDIEQILRKSFVQTRVKEFVSDLDADELHRQVRTVWVCAVASCFLLLWLAFVTLDDSAFHLFSSERGRNAQRKANRLCSQDVGCPFNRAARLVYLDVRG